MITALIISILFNIFFAGMAFHSIKGWESANEHWKDTNAAWGMSLEREAALEKRLEPFKGLDR